jgi:hypothetical protein
VPIYDCTKLCRNNFSECTPTEYVLTFAVRVSTFPLAACTADVNPRRRAFTRIIIIMRVFTIIVIFKNAVFTARLILVALLFSTPRSLYWHTYYIVDSDASRLVLFIGTPIA